MSRKQVYLTLAVVGLLLPYSQFIPWVFAHGLDPELFVEQLFANRISGFFAMDVVMSTVVLFTFMDYDQRPTKVAGAWSAGLGALLVGVSFGLPLYLYLRELALERTASAEPGVREQAKRGGQEVLR